MSTTLTEENYIKAIYHLGQHGKHMVNTNAIAEALSTKASSVTDMVKKLSDKGYLKYKKYQGVLLTENGIKIAAEIIRKHRLWEVFLVEKLKFNWDEVHEVAEDLEHIKSEKLIDELDAFLEFPTHDPHGDPIPDKNGNYNKIDKIALSQATPNSAYTCVGVKDTSSNFLKYLDNQNIGLGTTIEVIHKEPYDNSVVIRIQGETITVSSSVAKNLYLKLI